MEPEPSGGRLDGTVRRRVGTVAAAVSAPPPAPAAPPSDPGLRLPVAGCAVVRSVRVRVAGSHVVARRRIERCAVGRRAIECGRLVVGTGAVVAPTAPAPAAEARRMRARSLGARHGIAVRVRCVLGGCRVAGVRRDARLRLRRA